jgi:hypothetical protein
MKKVIFIIGFLFLFGNGYSQINLEWYRNFGNLCNLYNNPSEQSITFDTSGNIFSSAISLDTSNETILIITKLSNSGNLQWVKTHSLNYHSRNTQGNTSYIKTDQNGNVFVAFNLTDSLENDIVGLIKYNTSGELLWYRQYHDIENGDDYVSAIAFDAKDNILITGLAIEPYSGGYCKCLILKYNTEGFLIWERRMDEYTNGNDIATDLSGNVYIAGTIFSNNYGKNLMLTVKYDSSGNRKWLKYYGLNTIGYDQATKIILDDSLNVIVGGSSYTSNFSFTLIKYKNNGIQSWVKLYPNLSDFGNMTTDSRGNIYATGFSEYYLPRILKYDISGNLKANFSSTGISPNIVKYGGGKYLYVAGSKNIDSTENGQMYFAKIDTNLNIIYSHYFLTDTSNSGYYKSMIVDRYGNIFLSGISIYTKFMTSIYKLTTVKISQTTGIQSVSNIIINKFKLSQNYPNPFNPSTIIRFQIKDSRFVTLKIYDILGKEIETLVNEKLGAGEYESTFDGSNLSSGIYFYRLTADNFSDTKRMILIK